MFRSSIHSFIHSCVHSFSGVAASRGAARLQPRLDLGQELPLYDPVQLGLRLAAPAAGGGVEVVVVGCAQVAVLHARGGQVAP